MRLLHVGWGFRPFRYGGLIQYVEDLLEAQVERGDDVAYFFAARHYPRRRTARLRRWARDGVRMYEVQNSGLVIGGHRGTPDPLAELDHADSERLFARALDEHRPDVVHVHELLGLPSSLLELPRARGIPVVMTLQDYFLLCPTLKLWDADGANCRRRRPGAMCAVCCRDAPTDNGEFVRATLVHHQERILEGVPGLKHVPRPARLVAAFRRAEARVAGEPAPPAVTASTAAAPELYDRRRVENVRRLSRADLLIAMSSRVHELYAELGVDPAVLRTMQLTLKHIDGIRPKTIERVDGPVRFVTVAGFGNAMKGGDLLAGAVEQLEREGVGPDRLQLHVHGYVDAPYEALLERSPLLVREGYFAPEEMDAVLEPYHAGLMPSAWEEAYGYVGVELLAKGLPVAGNARGGITDYVRDGETGWRNTSNDAAGLAAIMRSIVEEPQQIAVLNARIRERRAELVKPMGEHVAEMAAVYAELAERRGRVAA